MVASIAHAPLSKPSAGYCFLSMNASVYSPETDEFSAYLSYALNRLEKGSVVLKDEQRSCIKELYQGHDVFLWPPTGFGKSLCYQVIPLLFDWKSASSWERENGQIPSVSSILVIQPLLSLMIDQVGQLRKCGISASILSYGESVPKTFQATQQGVSQCTYLFSSPEALLASNWREVITDAAVSRRVVAVVVDEAHCASKWLAQFPFHSQISHADHLGAEIFDERTVDCMKFEPLFRLALRSWPVRLQLLSA